VASASIGCVTVTFGVATNIDPIIGSLTRIPVATGGFADITLFAPTAAPEPASLAVGLAGLGMVLRTRRA
jgi:hypothetical protein